jgi:hypothetical protein
MQQVKPPPAANRTRGSAAHAPAEGDSSVSVQAFLDRHGLKDYLAAAERIATEELKPIQPCRVVLEVDPETREQWVEIGLVLSGEVEHLLDAYDRYTRRWVATAPVDVIGKIRLAYELV